MRKSVKVFSVAIILVAAGLVYAWPYVQMEFSETAHYTEQERRAYKFYTPDILRDMPRISTRYDFSFANIAGPDQHVHTVRFYGTRDTQKIDSYLISKAYHKQPTCDISATCWKGADPIETIYVGTLTGENTVIVQVAYDL